MADHSPDTLKLIAFLIITGLTLFIWAIRNHRRARKIQDTPRSKIASAPQGYAEFEGFAWPASDVFDAPGGFKAVYYSFQLQREETRGSGKNRKRVWVTVFSFAHGGHFYLVDATGLALIDWKGAALSLDSGRTQSWRSVSETEKNRILTKVMKPGAVPGFPPSTFLFGLFSSKYRIVENKILVGSPIYACGDFRSKTAIHERITRPGLSQFCERVFDPKTRSTKDLKHLLDKNGDQKITPEEAQLGYAMAARGAWHAAETQTLEEREFELCGTISSSPEHKLLFADVHEHHFLHRLQRFFWLKFAGGAVLLSAGITLAVAPETFDGADHFEPAAAPGPVRTVETSLASSAELHQSCVDGMVDSCRLLVRNQTRFRLSADYLKYYRKRACDLGATEFCGR